MGKLQQNKGITLIALIVTIVVLLILAGVSIAVITGDDGVIKSANQAKTEQRGGTVEDRVAVWKAGKATSEYTHRETKTEDEMLNDLINDKLLFEDEIDRENKKIAIGSKEIDYSTGNGNGLKLEPDNGKEELILEYEVSAGDTIELPCYFYSEGAETVEFDFQINWGDGTTETGITNDNISTKSKHQYQDAGTYDIKIKGKYESLQTSYDARETANYDKLKKVKQWGTTGLKYVAFYGCSNLNEIASPTENSFINLIDISFEYTKIQTIPENLFANCPNITTFSMTFTGCNYLTSIPEDLFANCTNVTEFYRTFDECEHIANIPGTLFENCSNVKIFYETFSSCYSLTSVPEKLFDNCKKVESFGHTFGGCFMLTGNAPELWKRGTNSEENEYKGNPDGVNCFSGCTRLQNYDEIPDYWKKGRTSSVIYIVL